MRLQGVGEFRSRLTLLQPPFGNHRPQTLRLNILKGVPLGSVEFWPQNVNVFFLPIVQEWPHCSSRT